ncbi:hypothetical protein WR25_06511 [Diploscapter pachys]|uniref:Uncharacterized protein n=1 Tax=Diploscapter pachys TaxID=2018661 RepID=A0A2A2JXJ0_9BILA|nr:hypothetical protein WR25_06511 [Diploscapter pachys]
MGEQLVGRGLAAGAQMLDGAAHVKRVPVHDRGGDQRQPGRFQRLVLELRIAQAALFVDEHGLGERVTRLALVEPSLTLLAERPGF